SPRARRPRTAQSRSGRSSARAVAAMRRWSSSTELTASLRHRRTCPRLWKSSAVQESAVPKREVLLAHADERDLAQLSEYRGVGGYSALEKSQGMDPEALIEALVTSTLRGRGGAGFPTGRKASLVD